MVVLTHIHEESVWSLGSYCRLRMKEELKEQWLDVGHPLPDIRFGVANYAEYPF